MPQYTPATIRVILNKNQYERNAKTEEDFASYVSGALSHLLMRNGIILKDKNPININECTVAIQIPNEVFVLRDNRLTKLTCKQIEADLREFFIKDIRFDLRVGV